MSSEAGHRLYVKGKHLSYQRGKRNTNPNCSILKLEGVEDPKAATFYCGKKVAFIYRASKARQGSKIRVIWGKVTRPHGNSGLVSVGAYDMVLGDHIHIQKECCVSEDARGSSYGPRQDASLFAVTAPALMLQT